MRKYIEEFLVHISTIEEAEFKTIKFIKRFLYNVFWKIVPIVLFILAIITYPIWRLFINKIWDWWFIDDLGTTRW